VASSAANSSAMKAKLLACVVLLPSDSAAQAPLTSLPQRVSSLCVVSAVSMSKLVPAPSLSLRSLS
jgi:hypothetical protein